MFVQSHILINTILWPVEVDQSFGALLMTWGLCTVPYHGENCSAGAVRRRRVGEAKGLLRSGVNGAVKGLCGPPTMERAKTDAGVFISNVGLGLIISSVPEVPLEWSVMGAFQIFKPQMCPAVGRLTYSNKPDVSDEVFLSLPVDRDFARPLVATVSW